MNDISGFMRDELLCHGAALVGFGDLSALPPGERAGMPVGVAVAVVYPGDVIRRIANGPTAEYREHYDRLNEKLDMLVTLGADALKALGYQAIPQTREVVRRGANAGQDAETLLPHKTVATRAGLGWIGKCALLVTREYGSAVRISSILTDAPLKTARPVDGSRCGSCTACAEACPGHAVLGREWSAGIPREEFYDAELCRTAARKQSLAGFGADISLCGKCIEICPHTRKYIIPSASRPDSLGEDAPDR
jgi:epoxyqueuosine reductase QueG